MEPVLVLVMGLLNMMGQLNNYGIDVKKNPHLKNVRVRRDVESQLYALDNKNYENVPAEPYALRNKDHELQKDNKFETYGSMENIETENEPYALENKDAPPADYELNGIEGNNNENLHDKYQQYNKENEGVNLKTSLKGTEIEDYINLYESESSHIRLKKANRYLRKRHVSKEYLISVYNKHKMENSKEYNNNRLYANSQQDNKARYLNLETPLKATADKNYSKSDNPERTMNQKTHKNLRKRYIPTAKLLSLFHKNKIPNSIESYNEKRHAKSEQENQDQHFENQLKASKDKYYKNLMKTDGKNLRKRHVSLEQLQSIYEDVKNEVEYSAKNDEDEINYNQNTFTTSEPSVIVVDSGYSVVKNYNNLATARNYVNANLGNRYNSKLSNVNSGLNNDVNLRRYGPASSNDFDRSNNINGESDNSDGLFNNDLSLSNNEYGTSNNRYSTSDEIVASSNKFYVYTKTPYVSPTVHGSLKDKESPKYNKITREKQYNTRFLKKLYNNNNYYTTPNYRYVHIKHEGQTNNANSINSNFVPTPSILIGEYHYKTRNKRSYSTGMNTQTSSYNNADRSYNNLNVYYPVANYSSRYNPNIPQNYNTNVYNSQYIPYGSYNAADGYNSWNSGYGATSNRTNGYYPSYSSNSQLYGGHNATNTLRKRRRRKRVRTTTPKVFGASVISTKMGCPDTMKLINVISKYFCKKDDGIQDVTDTDYYYDYE